MRSEAPKESKAARESRVEIDLHWCKSCGICAGFCPPGALVADETGTPRLADPGKCTGCGICELMCPDFAIEVHKKR